MNLFHRYYCNSDGWATVVKKRMIPWVLEKADLGDNVLEIGPGPGRTTEWLRDNVPHLTAIEIDHKLAQKLQRFASEKVRIVEGDATKMSLLSDTYSSAVCFTMLHHVPSESLQDKLLAEAFRVLRPGGLFTGSDSTPSLRWRIYHIMDTCVAIDPAKFEARLKNAGFTNIAVEALPKYHTFKFSARKPS
ncbi:MAG: methyltransferase domain-containing protein [Chloroflexota bacterium]